MYIYIPIHFDSILSWIATCSNPQRKHLEFDATFSQRPSPIVALVAVRRTLTGQIGMYIATKSADGGYKCVHTYIRIYIYMYTVYIIIIYTCIIVYL